MLEANTFLRKIIKLKHYFITRYLDSLSKVHFQSNLYLIFIPCKQRLLWRWTLESKSEHIVRKYYFHFIIFYKNVLASSNIVTIKLHGYIVSFGSISLIQHSPCSDLKYFLQCETYPVRVRKLLTCNVDQKLRTFRIIIIPLVHFIFTSSCW